MQTLPTYDVLTYLGLMPIGISYDSLILARCTINSKDLFSFLSNSFPILLRESKFLGKMLEGKRSHHQITPHLDACTPNRYAQSYRLLWWREETDVPKNLVPLPIAVEAATDSLTPRLSRPVRRLIENCIILYSHPALTCLGGVAIFLGFPEKPKTGAWLNRQKLN